MKLGPAKLLGLALFAVGAGCSRGYEEYIVIFDNSGSAEDLQPRQEAEFVVAFENLPPDAKVTVLRMGSSTVETDTGSVGEETAESFVLRLREDMKVRDPHRGTDFAAMAEAMRDAANRSGAQSIRFRVFTDGGNDFVGDRERTKRYAAAASSIAADRRVASVTFSGVRAGFREGVRKVWAGCGSRLAIESW